VAFGVRQADYRAARPVVLLAQRTSAGNLTLIYFVLLAIGIMNDSGYPRRNSALASASAG
jgi:hypothetical protein